MLLTVALSNPGTSRPPSMTAPHAGLTARTCTPKTYRDSTDLGHDRHGSAGEGMPTEPHPCQHEQPSPQPARRDHPHQPPRTGQTTTSRDRRHQLAPDDGRPQE